MFNILWYNLNIRKWAGCAPQFPPNYTQSPSTKPSNTNTEKQTQKPSKSCHSSVSRKVEIDQELTKTGVKSKWSLRKWNSSSKHSEVIIGISSTLNFLIITILSVLIDLQGRSNGKEFRKLCTMPSKQSSNLHLHCKLSISIARPSPMLWS